MYDTDTYTYIAYFAMCVYNIHFIITIYIIYIYIYRERERQTDRDREHL